MKQSQSVSDVGVDSAHGWDADEHWWNADEHWWISIGGNGGSAMVNPGV
jgi:hypothetical protein